MNISILSKNGTALIGLLVSVLVIALVFFGSFYFYNKPGDGLDDLVEGNIIDVYQGAQSDILDINKNIESRNEEFLNDKKASSSVNRK